MPPPTELSKPPSNRVRVVVSSSDRNLSNFPSPNAYVIDFDEPFVDVVSLALLSAHFPASAYQIGPGNDRVPFRHALVAAVARFEAVLPHGDFEPPETLAAATAAAMNAACGEPGRYEVSYDARRDSFVFSSSGAFELLFGGGSAPFGPQIVDEFASVTSAGIVETVGVAGARTVVYARRSAARPLGFGPNDQASALEGAAHVVRAPFRRDPTRAKVAVMYVSGADVNASTGNAVHRSFAVFGPRQSELEAFLPDRGIAKGFNPPMGKLGRVAIRVCDLDGNPYDCQNHDHRLEFMVTCAPRFQAAPNWTIRAE